MPSEQPCLIYYHGADWDGVPARHRYLMAAMSKYLPVIFLDGTAEFKRKVTYGCPSPNVTVVRGLISIFLAMSHRGLHRAIPLYSKWTLRKLTGRFDKILFWNAENWARPYRYISHDILIYDCIDPAFTVNQDEVREYDRRELEVLGAASRVFASATSLYEKCRQHHPQVTLLNNACAPEDYDEKLIAASPKPAWWPETNKPIAAYLGSLDWRFDFYFVEKACADNPDVYFILAGNTLPQFTTRVMELCKLRNVTCPGKISVSDGRYLLKECAIGLIPFAKGEMNDAVNPVKMYAYALMGKPIVATATRETTGRSGIVMSAESPKEFSAAIREAISCAQKSDTASRLKKFALENTWELRAAQAWEVICTL